MIVAVGGTGVFDGIGDDVDVGSGVLDGVKVGRLVAVDGKGVSVDVEVYVGVVNVGMIVTPGVMVGTFGTHNSWPA